MHQRTQAGHLHPHLAPPQAAGGDGDDRIHGGADNDGIDGGDGEDWIEAGDGNDNIRGGSDFNIILVGRGNNIVLGGPDGDLILINPGETADNLVLGGGGEDGLMNDGAPYDEGDRFSGLHSPVQVTSVTSAHTASGGAAMTVLACPCAGSPIRDGDR